MDETALTSKKIGHYLLLSKLGEGGMGTVFLAQDDRLNRQVAIKCLKPQHLRSESNSQSNSQSPKSRLRREARMQAQLNHPNIVHIYDVIEEDEQFALVMECVEGKSLSRYLKEHSVGIKQKLVWLLQISRGLAAAHEKGLIHRDLKADNILIDQHGDAKITDFGIAKDQMSAEDGETETGQLLGSYTALSPEQAMGLRLDHRSDLFSLGILAFRVLCGRHPFGNPKNRNVLIQRILHEAPLSAKELNPQLSDTFVSLLEQLLAKKPEQRPDNAKQVFPLLQQCIRAQIQIEAEQTQDLSTTLDNQLCAKNDAGNQPFYRSVDGGLWARVKEHIDATRLKKRTFGFVLLVVIAFGSYGYWDLNKQPDPLYIAVLPPVINVDNPLGGQQQTLLKTAVLDALQQYVLATDNLYLISPSEVRSVDGTHAEIAKAIAADVLLESSLDCQKTFCEITLNRLQRGEAKNEVVGIENMPWTVFGAQQWKTLDLDNLLILNQASGLRTSQVFPEYQINSNLGHTVLSEEKYSQFLSWYHEAAIGDTNYEAILEELVKEHESYQLYLPYYDLYYYLSGKMFHDTQDVEYLNVVEQQLRKADRLLPNQLTIQRDLVILSLRKNDLIGINIELEKFMALNPLEEDALSLKARIAGGQGDYQEAIRLLKQVVLIRPTTSNWLDLSIDHLAVGNIEEAKNSLSSALSLNGTNYEGIQIQGQLAIVQGDLDLAIQAFQKAISINPQAQNFSNLGVAYLLNNNFKEANQVFQKTIDFTPNNAAINLNLADSFVLLNQPEKAVRYYEKVLFLERGQDNWSSLLNVAQAYAHLQRPSEALKAVHQSLRIAPDSGDALFTAALVHSLIGQWSTALIFIEQSIEQGINPRWYFLPWFDSLCEEQLQEFIKHVDEAEGGTRCPRLI